MRIVSLSHIRPGCGGLPFELVPISKLTLIFSQAPIPNLTKSINPKHHTSCLTAATTTTYVTELPLPKLSPSHCLTNLSSIVLRRR